jgi:hypothetical protein
MVRRAYIPVEGAGGIEQGRVVDLIMPGFDRAVQEQGIPLPRGEQLILPLGVRASVLAAIAAVEQEGSAALQRLREGTLGNYRLGFDAIVAEAEAENRRRTTVSQLLHY